MFKNVASQKITVFAFDASTGLPKTGDAANITVYVSQDTGSVTALTDTSASEADATNAKGDYNFDLSQAETNADKLRFTGKSSTSNIVIVPQTIYTVPPSYAVGLADGAIASATFAAATGMQVIRSGTAQAGSGTTITLDASASATNDFYLNCGIRITGGTGAGQFRFISGYVGATKVATVRTWATNPDNTSTFAVHGFDTLSGLGGGLDAAGVRTAVGMASANLDTQLAAIDDYIDTEVAAIKAKTDNLPSDPADASDIASAFSTVNGTLATIAGYIDTEVGAIKAKTDLIPASPAAVSDIPTVNANADALLDRANAIETGTTLRQAIKYIAAEAAGDMARSADVVTFKGIGTSSTRITATVDDDTASRDVTSLS